MRRAGWVRHATIGSGRPGGGVVVAVQPVPQPSLAQRAHLVLWRILLKKLQGDGAVEIGKQRQEGGVVDLQDGAKFVELGGSLLDQANAILAGDPQGDNLRIVRFQRAQVLMEGRQEHRQDLSVDLVGMLMYLTKVFLSCTIAPWHAHDFRERCGSFGSDSLLTQPAGSTWPKADGRGDSSARTVAARSIG